MNGFFRYSGKVTWFAIALLIAAFGGLALFEVYAKFQFGDPDDDLKYEAKTYISSTYFDYVSGAPHVFGPGSHTGPIRSETIQYDEGYDYSINKFGFFTEIPLDEYPAKRDNEFRIVLIGGSGAQGWGAQTVDRMLHNQLERKLDTALEPAGIDVDVINLAMAGSHIITNADTLYGYARHLEPDLVLAYLGVNDISAMLQIRQLRYARQTGAVRNPNGLPRGLSTLADLFPTTMVKLGVAEDIKRWLGIFSNERGMPRFDPYTRLGWNEIPPTQYYTDYIVPETARALETIKRDFCGLPIVLARQIWFPAGQSANLIDTAYGVSLGDGIDSYAEWWDRLRERLPGYVNDEWYFLDAHGAIWDQVLGTASVDIMKTFDRARASQDNTFTFEWIDGMTYEANELTFGAHLDNTGHLILADWLAPQVAALVEANFERSRTDLCELNFRSKP